MSKEDNKKAPVRKDRLRGKKKSHKLTERQVEMIRSQKGKMSVREIAKWFAKKNHYQIKISPSMVHFILSGKMHKSKEEKVSIYDLINKDISDEDIENLNPKDVKYE